LKEKNNFFLVIPGLRYPRNFARGEKSGFFGAEKLLQIFEIKCGFFAQNCGFLKI